MVVCVVVCVCVFVAVVVFVYEGLVWDEPLQNGEHNRMVQACVAKIELETNPERTKLYTSTSIRVGNQEITENEVQRLSL
jgi:hypothetical protein